MSSSMFKRLCEALVEGCDIATLHEEARPRLTQRQAAGGVAALLREMREPSEFQIEAGRRKRTEMLGSSADAIYTIMIDAILAEAPEGVRGDE